MKIITLTLLLFNLPASGQSFGSSYDSNFSSLGAVGSDVNGQDGWGINDTTDQFSFVANWNSSKAIGLGDVTAVDDPPSGDVVRLFRSIASPLGQTSVKFDFALIDSFTDSGALNRDLFGISLATGLSENFRIILSPNDPSPTDPDDNSENLGNGGQWNLDYQVNGGATMPLNMAVFEGATYEFVLSFAPNANPLLTDFNLAITGSNTLSDGASGIALDSSLVSDEFGIYWEKVGQNDFGSNVFLMDNLSVVPEPSTAFLGVLGIFGLVARRKRNTRI